MNPFQEWKKKFNIDDNDHFAVLDFLESEEGKNLSKDEVQKFINDLDLESISVWVFGTIEEPPLVDEDGEFTAVNFLKSKVGKKLFPNSNNWIKDMAECAQMDGNFKLAYKLLKLVC